MRVASYCRVSTDEQAERGFSIDEQKERNEKWCKDRGYAPPVHYIDDGYSAKNTKRPDYQRLMNDVKRKQYDIVISTKTDRLTRNLLDLLNAVDYLDRYDCRYHSVSEDIDVLTAPGKLQLQVLGMFAEFERNRISENVQNTMKSIARKSGETKKAFTVPCYGYDVVDGKYAINEHEAEGVRLAAQTVISGGGIRAAVIEMNKSHRTRNGLTWHRDTLKNLLRRETLNGKLIYNRTYRKNGKRYTRPEEEWIVIEDHHPPILDDQTFAELQNVLNGRYVARKQADNEKWLLSGLVRCAHCGRTMKGHRSETKNKNKPNKEYLRYLCQGYEANGDCFYHCIYRDELESYIIDQIKDIAAAGNGAIKLSVVGTKNKEDGRKQIETKLNRLDQRIQKQIEAYEDDLISAADLKKARERVDEERANLTKALERLETGDNSDERDSVKEIANRVLNDLLSGDRLSIKNAIRQVVHRITVSNGETVDIVWNTTVI